mgnify:CR=1 FL=1
MFKKNPKITIITVVKNGEKYLEKNIKSLMNQSYKNYEHIIIDGSSTDKSMEIAEKYKDQIYKIISEKDNGLYDAMNKGIKNANGDIIGMTTADAAAVAGDGKIMDAGALAKAAADGGIGGGMVGGMVVSRSE